MCNRQSISCHDLLKSSSGKHIWRFPKMGIPPNHPFWGIPIVGNLRKLHHNAFRQRQKEGSHGRFAFRHQLWKERATDFKRQRPAETAWPAHRICDEFASDQCRISRICPQTITTCYDPCQRNVLTMMPPCKWDYQFLGSPPNFEYQHWGAGITQDSACKNLATDRPSYAEEQKKE